MTSSRELLATHTQGLDEEDLRRFTDFLHALLKKDTTMTMTQVMTFSDTHRHSFTNARFRPFDPDEHSNHHHKHLEHHDAKSRV